MRLIISQLSSCMAITSCRKLYYFDDLIEKYLFSIHDKFFKILFSVVVCAMAKIFTFSKIMRQSFRVYLMQSCFVQADTLILSNTGLS